MKPKIKITFTNETSLLLDGYGAEIMHEESIQIDADDDQFVEDEQVEEGCENVYKEECQDAEPLRKLARVFVNKCYQEMQQAA